MRSLRIVGAKCGPFDIALIPDGPQEAFEQAIAARTQLSSDAFYLTAGTSDGPVVSLSAGAALPESVKEVYVHLLQQPEVDKPKLRRRLSLASGVETVEWTVPHEQKVAVVSKWRAFRKGSAPSPAQSVSESAVAIQSSTSSPAYPVSQSDLPLPYPMSEAEAYKPASAPSGASAALKSFSLDDPLVRPPYCPRAYGVDPEGRLPPERGCKGVLNFVSALVLAMYAMTTCYSAVGCAVASVSTYLYWQHAYHLAVELDWTAVSLIVILPTSQGISMAFRRREVSAALAALAVITVACRACACLRVHAPGF